MQESDTISNHAAGQDRPGVQALSARGRAVRRCGLDPSDSGFGLVGLVVAIFLLLLAMSVAAPRVARALRRDREVETLRRADQYTRAIRLYYKKFGHYPASVEQLEKTNNIRFLRQKYIDPMTGKSDWRLIHVGEQKTTVKGFFGKPLTGVASAGLGSASGLASAGGVGAPVGATGLGAGATGGSGFGGMSTGSTLGSGPGAGAGASSGFSLGSSGVGAGSAAGGGTTDSSAGGTTATTAGGNNSAASGGAFGGGFGSNPGSSSASDSSGGGGPFLGIGVPKDGESIMTVNEQTTYDTWEFLYDPRIEQLRSRVNLLGGGMASTSAGSLGSASGMKSGTDAGSPTSTGTGTGTSPGGTSTPPAGSANPTTPPQP